jgi:hypothetical protein
MTVVGQGPLQVPIIFHTRESEGWKVTHTQLFIYKRNSADNYYVVHMFWMKKPEDGDRPCPRNVVVHISIQATEKVHRMNEFRSNRLLATASCKSLAQTWPYLPPTLLTA